MKQLGGKGYKRYKRDKLEDFPEDLRIREFPDPVPPPIFQAGDFTLTLS